MARNIEVVLPELHGGQQRIKDAPGRYKVVMCGRRWGKTWFGESEVCEGALQGQYWAWFAPSYKYTQEVWRDLLSLLGDAVQNKNASEHRIELYGGGVIEIWTLAGADPDDVARGRKYHGVVIDEAGLVPDLLSIFQKAIRATLTDYQGTALFLGTPKGRRHDFTQIHLRGLTEAGQDPHRADGEGGWNAFNGETIENTFIEGIEEEVAAAKRELPEHIFNQEYRGIPSDDGLNPFGLQQIADATAPASEYDTVCWGVDLAKSQDWVVVVGLDEWGRWTRFERWQGPWNVTKAKLLDLCKGAPALIDSTGVGSPVLEDLQWAGMDAYPYLFHDGSKRQLVQRLIVALSGHRTTIAEGEPVVEFKAFEAEVRKNGKVSYGAPDGVHDDCVVGWGLAYTMYERLGTLGNISHKEELDYIRMRVDPDANPEMQRQLFARDAREGQYEERQSGEQFSTTFYW